MLVWALEIVAFKVTLEFGDVAQLRKLVAERLFKAREKKFRTDS
jgi:tetraacyldisaccharide 4'-kinase